MIAVLSSGGSKPDCKELRMGISNSNTVVGKRFQSTGG